MYFRIMHQIKVRDVMCDSEVWAPLKLYLLFEILTDDCKKL
jgi:hypothetical protein